MPHTATPTTTRTETETHIRNLRAQHVETSLSLEKARAHVNELVMLEQQQRKEFTDALSAQYLAMWHRTEPDNLPAFLNSKPEMDGDMDGDMEMGVN